MSGSTARESAGLPRSFRQGALSRAADPVRMWLRISSRRYVSDCWSHVITAPSDATISDNYAHIFRAKNCRKAGGQELDDSEYLHVELKSPEQIDGLIREGGFQQIVHMLGWMLVKGE